MSRLVVCVWPSPVLGGAIALAFDPATVSRSSPVPSTLIAARARFSRATAGRPKVSTEAGFLGPTSLVTAFLACVGLVGGGTPPVLWRERANWLARYCAPIDPKPVCA